MSEPHTPPIAVVVLNYNGLEDTIACVHSLLSCDARGLYIVAVDNHSRNDEAAAIAAEFPEIVTLRQTSNLGYTGGNNVGMARAMADGVEYVLVLNNDTTVRADTISTLLEFMQEHPSVGVCGPVTLDAASTDTVFAAGGRTDFKGRCWNNLPGTRYEDVAGMPPFDIEYLQGSALFLRSATLRAAGLFDERFFLNYDETDLCARIRDTGQGVFIVPSAVYWHKIGATIGRFSATQHYYMHRNRMLFLAKRRRWFGLAATYALCCVHAMREKDPDLKSAGWHAVKDFTARRFGQRRSDREVGAATGVSEPPAHSPEA